jgi:ubiquinone/menaquinone biosynthesis C-methylase UbiE
MSQRDNLTDDRERDHKERSRLAFDRQAREYDQAAFGRHARRLQADVLAAVATFAFTAVLDVGCGTGALLEAILGAHPGVSAYGVDLSTGMLAVAVQRLAGMAKLQVADAEHLPIADDAVDLVVCVDSFHHYPHPQEALREMHRVTRPGGGLVIGEWRVVAPIRQLMNLLLPRLPEGDVRIYTGRELTSLVEAAGYSAVRCAPAAVRAQLLVAQRQQPLRQPDETVWRRPGREDGAKDERDEA